MTPCSKQHLIQDWLDGLLPEPDAAAFSSHLGECAACDVEVAAYRRVYAELAALPLLDPRPDFEARVLAAVLPAPSPLWVRALGWGYAASLGASVVALVAAMVAPGPRSWTLELLGEGARSLAGAAVFVLRAFNETALRSVEALGTGGAIVARVTPVAKQVTSPFAHPEFLLVLGAGVAAGIALLWWMRPRESRSSGEIGNVGILGL